MRINYLDKELMKKLCHRLAVAVFDTKDDPIAPFDDHTELLESAINNPKQTFDGKDLYPTLIDKAAILYYSLNRNHPFKNGNKRISAASLMVFLYINGFWLCADKQEIVDKTLYIARSDLAKKDKVMQEITQWIKKHSVKLND